MINLIPKQEKKEMARDFYYRLIVVCLTMLSVCIFVAALLMTPAYFLSMNRSRIANEKLNTQRNIVLPLSDQETGAIIDDLNNKLSIVENSKNNSFLVSNIITQITSFKGSYIKITQISYENNGKDKKISVSGVAPSRDSLLNFRKALEESKLFKSVDLPISSFVKDSNIQFYVSLIPA